MQEESKGFGNNFNHEATRLFFRRWWKVLLIVFIVGAIGSGIAAWLTTPLYKSSAVIFPSNSNRLSKAIMDYHYSMDFMDYGSERDCEYAIHILTSKRMEQAVCEHFNLMEHYNIPSDDKYKLTKLDEQYQGYITVERTEFLGVEIDVLDKDPQLAADIANYIASMYDTLCHEIHHDRAISAAEVMKDVCASMEHEIDSLAQLPKADWRDKLITEKCSQLANLQTRATQTDIDKDLEVSYKYNVDLATPSDKKAYPKRLIIILGGSLGAVVVAILALLIFAKKEEN